MRIHDWADRLGMYPHPGTKGPEDFWTICPCHADTSPSLHVSIGKKDGQTVMKCFVCGATGAGVCKALGIPLGELACDARTGEKQETYRHAPEQGEAKSKKSKNARPFKIGQDWHGHKITNIYEYRNRDGDVVLRKARGEKTDETGKRIGKTFAIQSVGPDGKWVYSAGAHKNLLYHLPEVLEAVKEGKRILVAEGEKDVDNLRALGFAATCGLFGGGKYTGKDHELAGKWNDEHSDAFNGAAEVIVIPDNDAAGEGIAQWICRKLEGRVKALKIMRIVESCPELPEHGDFTDWVVLLKAQGLTKKKEVLDRFDALLDAAPAWAHGNIRRFEQEESMTSAETVSSASAQASTPPSSGGGKDGDYPDYYGSLSYCIKSGRLARRVKDGAQILCDFLPIPRETVAHDDGGSLRTEYIIGGKKPNGSDLPDAHVDGEADLVGMRWAMRAWQHWGNVKPVKNASLMILDAINGAGQRISKHREVYEHTGMRSVAGKMVYLYNGGCIGGEGVSVELGGDLKHYNLCDRGETREDAAAAELMLLQGFPSRIIYPQLAQAYLAPLYSVMEKLQRPPSYVVFVIGDTNAGKSTVTGYVQSHFGDFYNRRFPARFTDTVNAARDKLFWAKDALLVVDDYQRDDSVGRMRSAQDMVANGVISAVADLADRSRLDVDKRQSESRPPRCTCIMTGEDLPHISSSRFLRIYRIDVALGDIYKESATELEPYRLMARAGIYSQCMRYYIEDLIGRWDSIETEIEDRIERMSLRMGAVIRRKEGRLTECATHLMVGVELMLDHLVTCRAIDNRQKHDMLAEAERVIVGTIEEQGVTVDESKPEAVWLQALRSLIITRAVTIRSRDEIGDGFSAGVIGFYDDMFYYLDPEATDEAIAERLRKGGRTLGASRPAILRALARQGKVFCKLKEDGGIKETTWPMRVGRAQQRMIRIYKWVISGEEPPPPNLSGFVPVPKGEQIEFPFEE